MAVSKPGAKPLPKPTTTNTAAGFQSPYKYITRNGKRVLVQVSQMTPAERAQLAAAPASPTVAAETPLVEAEVAPAPVAPPPAPGREQFAGYQDADYWDGLAGLRNQLGLIENPDGSLVSQAAQSRLTQLGQRINPTTMQADVNGETLYDILYKKQTAQDARNLTSARDQGGKYGVVRSGWMDGEISNVASQSAAATDQLIRGYGTDLNDSRSAAFSASQSQADAIRQYQSQQGTLARSAAERGYSNAVNRYQQTYGGY